MRENGNVPSHHNAKEKVLNPRRRNMMWRFHQYIACIGQCEQSSGSQSTNKICNDVIVGTSDQAQRYPRLVQHSLQMRHGRANLRPSVVVKPRQDMWRTSNDLHAIGREQLSHLDGSLEIRGSIVDAGQNMIMQIYHDRWLFLTGRIRPNTVEFAGAAASVSSLAIHSVS